EGEEGEDEEEEDPDYLPPVNRINDPNAEDVRQMLEAAQGYRRELNRPVAPTTASRATNARQAAVASALELAAAVASARVEPAAVVPAASAPAAAVPAVVAPAAVVPATVVPVPRQVHTAEERVELVPRQPTLEQRQLLDQPVMLREYLRPVLQRKAQQQPLQRSHSWPKPQSPPRTSTVRPLSPLVDLMREDLFGDGWLNRPFLESDLAGLDDDLFDAEPEDIKPEDLTMKSCSSSSEAVSASTSSLRNKSFVASPEKRAAAPSLLSSFGSDPQAHSSTKPTDEFMEQAGLLPLPRLATSSTASGDRDRASAPRTAARATDRAARAATATTTNSAANATVPLRRPVLPNPDSKLVIPPGYARSLGQIFGWSEEATAASLAAMLPLSQPLPDLSDVGLVRTAMSMVLHAAQPLHSWHPPWIPYPTANIDMALAAKFPASPMVLPTYALVGPSYANPMYSTQPPPAYSMVPTMPPMYPANMMPALPAPTGMMPVPAGPHFSALGPGIVGPVPVAPNPQATRATGHERGRGDGNVALPAPVLGGQMQAAKPPTTDPLQSNAVTTTYSPSSDNIGSQSSPATRSSTQSVGTASSGSRPSATPRAPAPSSSSTSISGGTQSSTQSTLTVHHSGISPRTGIPTRPVGASPPSTQSTPTLRPSQQSRPTPSDVSLPSNLSSPTGGPSSSQSMTIVTAVSAGTVSPRPAPTTPSDGPPPALASPTPSTQSTAVVPSRSPTVTPTRPAVRSPPSTQSTPADPVERSITIPRSLPSAQVSPIGRAGGPSTPSTQSTHASPVERSTTTPRSAPSAQASPTGRAGFTPPSALTTPTRPSRRTTGSIPTTPRRVTRSATLAAASINSRVIRVSEDDDVEILESARQSARSPSVIIDRSSELEAARKRRNDAKREAAERRARENEASETSNTPSPQPTSSSSSSSSEQSERSPSPVRMQTPDIDGILEEKEQRKEQEEIIRQRNITEESTNTALLEAMKEWTTTSLFVASKADKESLTKSIRDALNSLHARVKGSETAWIPYNGWRPWHSDSYQAEQYLAKQEKAAREAAAKEAASERAAAKGAAAAAAA
ncbi:hypothetical protein PFISCL1PPCAC_28168, partial [Pristionchus fissidentatus]